MNTDTIKHILVYFLVFVMIIGLTSTFAAKQFIGQASEIGLKGEDMIKMQVALNDARVSPVQNNSQSKKKTDGTQSEIEETESTQDHSIETYQKGDSNEKIKEYQQILIGLEYLKGNPDGNYGEMTQGAIIEYQRDKNIEKTGNLDIPTIKSLEEDKKEQASNLDKEEKKRETQEQSKVQEETQTNVEHIVKSGETISHVSSKYNLSSRKILQANNLPESAVLQIGQKLMIPQN